MVHRRPTGPTALDYPQSGLLRQDLNPPSTLRLGAAFGSGGGRRVHLRKNRTMTVRIPSPGPPRGLLSNNSDEA